MIALPFQRVRFVMAGFLCLWLLCVLHSSNQLFHIEQEYEQQQQNYFQFFTTRTSTMTTTTTTMEREYRKGETNHNHHHGGMIGSSTRGHTFFNTHSRNLSTITAAMTTGGVMNNNNNNNINTNMIVIGNMTELNNHIARNNGTFLLRPKRPKLKDRKAKRQEEKNNTTKFPKKKKKKKFANWWPFGENNIVPLDLPKPVFVMGFPKAGTSSIFTFFQSQGLYSQHWYCCTPQTDPQQGGPALMSGCLMHNLRQNNNTDNIFEGCGPQMDVYAEINGPRRRTKDPITGIEGNLQDDGSIDITTNGKRIFLPQHFHMDKIHMAYPNSTWILNHRPVDDWIKSVMKWGDNLEYQFANEYVAQRQLIDTVPTNHTEMVQFLKIMYEDHVNAIRQFVKDHPTHALVEVTITDDDAGKVLADAFGLDESMWLHRNKNERGTFKAYMQRIQPRVVFEGTLLWWILVLLVSLYILHSVGFVSMNVRW